MLKPIIPDSQWSPWGVVSTMVRNAQLVAKATVAVCLISESFI